MIDPFVLGALLWLAIPSVALLYRWLQDVSPSDREKHAWLHVAFLVSAVNALVIGDYWEQFDEVYGVYEPLFLGVSGGAATVLIYYIYRYGWVNSEDDSPNATSSS